MSHVKNSAVEALLEAASRRTGLSDWGDDDHFRTALGVFLETIKNEELKPEVRLSLSFRIITNLKNRLQIQEAFKRYPAILEQPIHNPLYIVSLPRTGTTLLQRLLAQDAYNRPLLFWEASMPAPPPEPEQHENDPRINKIVEYVKYFKQFDPDLDSIHLLDAKKPEECFFLIDNSLVWQVWPEWAPKSQYAEWISKQDMVPIYQYYRQQLQILQYRFPPKRWLLKGPLHMNYLQALFTVFPDACVIQTHRDPLKVIPSISSLAVKSKRWLYNNVDVKETSQTVLAGLEKMLHTALQVRDSVGERHFFDVDYQELIRNPIGTVRKIYDHFGYPFEKVFEEKMRHYLAENQQHKHGVHRYSLEQFGLDADEIKHRFQWYCERFGIEAEK